MKTRYLRQFVLAAPILFGLAACGGDGDSDSVAPIVPPVPPVVAGDSFAVTISNKLVSFNRTAPGTVVTNVQITGLQTGENILGIDYRPADGQLYGLGSTGRIYTINTGTAVATSKALLAADATDTTAPYTALTGTDFGVDFNPVADRLRVISNTGQNLRINVDTGATTTDGNINGGAVSTVISAAAYTNSFATTATTTLYDLDTGTDTLYVQNPPNDGTLSTPVSLGIDATGVNGFDVDARNNTGYALLTVGGTNNLYTVNLAATSNAATLVGSFGLTEGIRGLALPAPAVPVAYGLTESNRLAGFKPLTPNTIDSNVAITGIGATESVVGIDFRPRDGLLYALTNTGRLFTVDTVTGTATFKFTLAADTTDTTLPYTSLAGTLFAVDFNPVADRLRVISNTGQSLRINVDTGATTTDGSINRTGAIPVITAAAYSNNFFGAATTTLNDIDTDSDNLALQNPPNDGTLVNIGPLGVDAVDDNGFDIVGGANGLALAVLRTAISGPATLYRINLTTGAATPVNAAAGASVVGGASGLPLRDVAIALK